MSRLRGGCQQLEEITGMPTPEGGCCISCISDLEEGYDASELYADADWDNIPNCEPGDWFQVCCAHLGAWAEFRKSSAPTPQSTPPTDPSPSAQMLHAPLDPPTG